MKKFIFGFLIFFELLFPSFSLASHITLEPCIEVAHCVRDEIDVFSMVGPFNEIKKIIEDTPRTEIVELESDYLHAEVTSKWMKYIDDLEISYLPESDKLQIRSESRVGESDLGVNRKRVDKLISKMDLLDSN